MARFKDITGERFGMLVVMEIAEDHISPNGKKDKQWLCKCDCGNEIVVRGSYLRTGNKKHCGCNSKRKKKQPEQKPEAWNDLYRYIEKNVLGYDKNQTLSKYMVLRVQGLRNGKHIANNKIKGAGNYSCEVIFNTFKFCNADIQKRLRSMSFTDENHKFSYVLRIVENNLNDVYIRMKNTKKAEEKAKSVKIESLEYEGAKYQKKTKKASDTASRRLKDLW